MKIERTPEGVDPYARAGVEPPDSLSVTAVTKEELGHMLRMCGTVRRMEPIDVAEACGLDPVAAVELFRNGEGIVGDTLKVLSFMRAHAILLPPVDGTGRYL